MTGKKPTPSRLILDLAQARDAVAVLCMSAGLRADLSKAELAEVDALALEADEALGRILSVVTGDEGFTDDQA